MVAKLSDRIEGNKYNGVGNANPNLLINGDRLINQRVFAGGQPAANVYGADRWKGSADGLQIEQVVENTESLDELATISWQGGTGTASVNGQSGLISGETFTLTTSGNYSVIVPTDASKIKLEYGNTATPYQARPIGEELALCQRYYRKYDYVGSRTAGFTGATQYLAPLEYSMRIAPTVSFSGKFLYTSQTTRTANNSSNLSVAAVGLAPSSVVTDNCLAVAANYIGATTRTYGFYVTDLALDAEIY